MANQNKNSESLTQYIKLIDRLFCRWKISSEDKFVLLGYDSVESDISSVSELILRQSIDQDLSDRISYLLAIHENLRLIFPKNKNLVYGWMTARCADFDDHTPVDIVKKHGLVGLNMLNEYLEKVKMV